MLVTATEGITNICLLVITRLPLLMHDIGPSSLAPCLDHSHSDWAKPVFTWTFMHSMHVWGRVIANGERCGKLWY